MYPTIQEILFADSRKRLVEHHHRLGVSAWQHCIYAQDSDVIELASIDVSFTLADVYHKAYLELDDSI